MNCVISTNSEISNMFIKKKIKRVYDKLERVFIYLSTICFVIF